MGADVPLDPAAVVGQLADDDRRRAFAAVVLGADGLDAVIESSGLDTRRTAAALSSLAAAGLVVRVPDGSLDVDGEGLRAAARAALSTPPSDEHADRPREVRKVLDAFVADGRVRSLPSKRDKRLVVLDWLAQDFEPGKRYHERMVDLVLSRRHEDTATLRRALVDEEFLDRADGWYWRAGGTVTDEPAPPDPS